MEVLGILIMTTIALAGAAAWKTKQEEPRVVLVATRDSPSGSSQLSGCYSMLQLNSVGRSGNKSSLRAARRFCEGQYKLGSSEEGDEAVEASVPGDTMPHSRMERRIRLQLTRVFERAGSYEQARLIQRQVARATPRPFRGLVRTVLNEVYTI